ncbi:hypothetical protein D3C72_792210 [compost metagenome]
MGVAGLQDGLGQELDRLADGRGIIRRHVGNPQAAAQVELLGDEAVLVADLGQEPHHQVRGFFEGVGVEDLAADVRLKAHPAQARVRLDEAHGRVELAAFEVEPELAVFLAGLDELVGVRLDAGRHAEQDARMRVELLGELGDEIQLVEVVDVDAARPRLEPHLELPDRLVVPLHHKRLGRHTGRQRGVHLAGGDHVHAEAFLVRDGHQGHGAVGLAGVEHAAARRVVGGEGLGVGAAGRPDGRLVEHVQGRAVGFRQLHHVATADHQVPGGVSLGRQRHQDLVGGELGAH